MAFRRSVPSRGRSFKRAFRSRTPRVRNVTRAMHWTPCNFNLNFIQTVEQGDSINTVIVLAQIMANVFRKDNQSNLAEMARSMEIGGIVFSYDFAHEWTYTLEPSGAFIVPNRLITHCDQLLLVTDRLDFDGAPTAITTDWWNTQTPVSLAISQTVLDEDVEYPTRIHFRKAHWTNPSFTSSDLIATGLGGIADTQRVTPSGGSANLRLRKRLSDEQVLAFHFTSRLDSPLDATGIESITTRFRAVGTLYWRLGKFG